MTIEELTTKAIAAINYGVDEWDAIAGALSAWGLYNIQCELDRVSRVLTIMEGDQEIPNFSFNRARTNNKWLAYHKGLWVTTNGAPRYFDSKFDAIEWALNHGERYAKEDDARRFGNA